MTIKGKSIKLSDFFEEYYGELVSHFTRKLRSGSLASEIIHETYLRARTLGSTFHIDNPRAYLYRIATNLATDLFRKDQIRSTYFSPEPLHELLRYQAPSAETMVADKQRLALLLRSIDELPPRCREVLILRKLEELDNGQIAQRLGISRSMVEKHLRKALLYCRNRLDQDA
ncbi:DNA-directed RNA polymerase sigma-70 factor [Nitrospira sp. KM1]|uniref:sigma-70 family RNA polymerase sigma factor n=1 Tax=Nitrospira sp. KM1 TaxID=1936990 RepID=UPI0013A79F02|nr:sigma-70 family RNA polymerase sigma factor [Nitrospira sp. KM1]BCA57169.1 DNA-directed RNA polymerase sigma-70 factor [Nitrospira sp. KM1]